MVWEETASMAIRTAPEKQEVKDGKLNAVLGGKCPHKFLLVLVGHFLRIVIVNVSHIDGVDLRRPKLRGNLVEKFSFDETTIAVFMIERYNSLVSKKDIPVREVGNLVFGSVVGWQKGICQDSG